MKKLAIAILAMITTAATASAQYYHSTVKRKGGENNRHTPDKFYARIAMGYAFQHAGDIYDALGAPYSGTENYDNNGNLTDYSYKKASLNTGVHGVLGVGYMLTRHIGVELSGDFGLAPKKYIYNANGWDISVGYTSNSTLTEHAQAPVYLMPALVLQSGGKLNLYMRAGLALPLNSKDILNEQDVYPNGGPNSTGTEIDNVELVLKSSFSMGYTGAVGLSYELGEHAKVFVEANMLSLSVYAKSFDYTQYNINGTNVLPQYQAQQQAQGASTGANFVFSGNANSPTNTLVTRSIPYSSIGLMVGFSFGF